MIIFLILLSAFVNILCYVDSFSSEADCLPSQEFQSVPKRFVNSIGMEFILILPDTFQMGSPPDEVGHDYTEEQHMVTIRSPFYIQTTEVTQGQWERVMGSNPSFFVNCGEDCPVENVSFYDVEEFIKKLNEIEKTDKYRLPTEAEWEYACRAGVNTPYNNGGTIYERVGFCNSFLDEIAWYYCNSKEGTHPVASKKPNNWGLFDMHGNVWEWCSDWYAKYPFGYSSQRGGPPQGWSKVRRGGSFKESPFFLRSAYRGSARPEVKAPDLGFRLVKDIPEPKTAAPEAKELRVEPGKVKKQIECIAAKDILFDINSDKIREDAVLILGEVIKIAKDNAMEIHLSGHACDLGSDRYNMDLSCRRVEAVRKYLLEHGIKDERIYTTFYGEKRPKVPNTDEEHRKLNRRVEIRVFEIQED